MRRRELGFTFVELMITVTIMGLLAAMAIPRVRSGRDRAVQVTMRSDLRNVAVAEESYFYDFATYAGTADALEARGFAPSDGSTVTINEATVVGWSATVAHASLPVKCYVYVGVAAPVGSAAEEGRVACS